MSAAVNPPRSRSDLLAGEPMQLARKQVRPSRRNLGGALRGCPARGGCLSRVGTAQVWERVEQRLLPMTTRVALWAGPGSGAACSLCGEVVGRDEIEYEVEERASEGVRIYRFHMACHAAWETALSASRM